MRGTLIQPSASADVDPLAEIRFCKKIVAPRQIHIARVLGVGEAQTRLDAFELTAFVLHIFHTYISR